MGVELLVDSNEEQEQIIKVKNKKHRGRTLTKTVLVLGTIGVVGYSVIKQKILGNPVSKIRKGLFYSMVAGVVLYKCQGEKVKEVYNFTSENLTERYNEMYELKKYNNKKIVMLNDNNNSLNKNISALENKLVAYSKLEDSLKNLNFINSSLRAEKNNLEEKLQKENLQKENLSKANVNDVIEYKFMEKALFNKKLKDEKTKNQNTNQSSKQNTSFKTSSKKYEYSNIFRASSELIYFPGDKEPVFISFHKDYSEEVAVNPGKKYLSIVWTQFKKDITLNDISMKYYNGKICPEEIARVNGIFCNSDECIPKGRPIALVENKLVNKDDAILGGYPYFVVLNRGESISEFIDHNYSVNAEIKKIMIRDVNIYNRGINEYFVQEKDLESQVQSLNQNYLCIYVPKYWPVTVRTMTPEKLGLMK